MKRSVKVKSKSWDWNEANTDYWSIPADEFIPVAMRWKEKGFKKVLDLGCGIGRHSLYLAQNGFSVDAFDLSREGLEKLAERIKKQKLKIRLQFGDMLDLPYRQNSFDCVAAIHTIHHTDFKGLKKVVASIYKILKPGGEAFVTLLSKEDEAWTKFASGRIDEHTLIKSEEGETNVPHTYLEYEEMLKLLKKFTLIKKLQIFKYQPNRTYAHFYILMKKK